ncbi:unnamed protein product [Brachionus calyciflorus]|uniref:Cation-transporting P-type ATPase C-terminal domain-containing protein n=1 Tax=Brachionus calyciflorus TaxID=104777 RepID=A0A813M2P4_9BILA|nr:unnamed protein product [Brachionus calyciflorus]
MPIENQIQGLDHFECLQKLHDQIEQILHKFKNEKLRPKTLIKSYLIKNFLEFLHNFLPIFICLLSILVPYNSTKNTWYIIHVLVLIAFFIINLIVLLITYFKTVAIIYHKSQYLLYIIRKIKESNQENCFENELLSVNIPFSQSVSNQIVYRNGRLINLPLNLVVEGDIIVLKPGQVINLNCKRLEKNSYDEEDIFEVGKVYEPELLIKERNNPKICLDCERNDNSILNLESFCLKQIPESILCEALETPYLNYLRTILNEFDCDSNSVITNEIKKVRKIFMFGFIPIVLFMQSLASILFHMLFTDSSKRSNESYWSNLVNLLIPLFPISFTFFWKSLNLYGTVCLLKMERYLKKLKCQNDLENTQQLKDTNSKSDCRKLNRKGKFDSKNNSNRNSENFSLLSNKDLDETEKNDFSSFESVLAGIPFEENYDSNSKEETSFFKNSFNNFKFYIEVLKIILFDNKNKRFKNENCFHNASFIYHSNFLIGLGITTNFSCIDKKGILAWPNPTAEKIWFINDKLERKIDSKNEVNNRNSYCEEMTNETHAKSEIKKDSFVEKKVFETFNLSHECTNGIQLKFDDSNWINNLNLFKPLGLSILLNTCNKEISKKYLNFCDFIRTQSTKITQSLHEKSHCCINNFDTVNTINNDMSYSSSLNFMEELYDIKAVMDRQCLCEISNIVGFDRESSTNSYKLVETSSLCRTLKIRSSCKFRPKQILLSNIFSAVAYSELNGINNIYSQGSPDLILDFCSDYWNGKEVRELNKTQRKKIVDLYQRFSVSSYCTAFSYKPVLDENLVKNLERGKNKVLECPTNVCDKLSSLDPLIRKIDDTSEESSLNLSYDDAFSGENKTHELQTSESSSSEFLDLTNDDLNCEIKKNILDLHSEQIFLGMVSMQYKAKIDVVKLVEKLTNSCIRFVHFSYDNENISKTFAEMLGLDSGWNCHISLASDSTTPNMSSNEPNSNENFEEKKKILKQKNQDLKWEKLQNLFSKKKTPIKASRPILSKKLSHGSSLPNLKLGKYSNLNSSLHCVKFNLPETSHFHKHQRKESKKRRLRLSSIERSSISSDSTSSLISNNYKLKTFSKKKTKSNTCQTSISSIKSTSILKETGRLNSLKKKSLLKNKLDDESSSDSERTLSETEIYGNAAQLPRGVDNIRRHLDLNIDNVPLHVPLFTDSTKPTIIQMIMIMKDYGEIVCCLGSSHSIENNSVFSVANVAISVEPVYPKLCVNSCILNKETNQINREESDIMDLSEAMNTLCCGINLKHDEICLFPPMMSLAREMVHSYRIALIFMLKSNLAVSLLQLISNLVFLPPILSGSQVTSLVVFTIPLLSYSLVHKNESNELRCSTKKNSNLINNQDMKSFAEKFLIKFCPSILILIIFHFLSLVYNCELIQNDHSMSHNVSRPTLCCHPFKNLMNGSMHYEYKENSIENSQIFNHMFMTVFLAFISVNYVCKEKSFWTYVPFKNKTWAKILVFILLIQSLILGINLLLSDSLINYISSLPVHYWVLICIWPIILVLFNEFYKVFEIKETIRQYKKSKLDFDTKLGMNSPFV